MDMNIFNIREDKPSWPPGANDSYTNIGGQEFSIDFLNKWHYEFYPENNTISNNSKCYLTFGKYTPIYLFKNGTFENSTSCYNAVNDIGTRGYTGITLAVLYGIGLVLTITALAKHGKLYLPKEERFYPIGRRWQWYWGLFVCSVAVVSLFTNVDVDRYYLQELPIVLTTFFWYLLCMGSTAQVWEAVRHWGSWQERQYIDPNHFVYATDDHRSKMELYLPLWFYFWTWMNFFMIVPRSWGFAEKQRSSEQTDAVAIPGASSVRFKVGAFCLVISLATILYSLRHSIKYYKPRNRGLVNRVVGFVRAIPFRFMLIIPLCAATIAYQACITWIWDFSVINAKGSIPVIYGWGYGPSLVILYVQILYGWLTMNEDKQLIRQRHERGEALDRELGISKKPNWWRRVHGDHLKLSLRDKISRNVMEVGGERGIGRRVENDAERDARLEALRAARDDDVIEMASIGEGNANNPRADRAGVKGLSRTTTTSTASPLVPQFDANYWSPEERARRAWQLMQDDDEVPPPSYSDASRREEVRRPNERRNSTSTTNSLSSPPQQVRSMLDV